LNVDPGWSGHPFGYAGANPTNYFDPTGLCWWGVPCPSGSAVARTLCTINPIACGIAIGVVLGGTSSGDLCAGVGLCEVISVGQIIGEYKINGQQRDIKLSSHAAEKMADDDIGTKEVMRIIRQAKGSRAFRYWDDEARAWKNGFWDGNKTFVGVADDGTVTTVIRESTREKMGRYVSSLKSRPADPGDVGEWLP
jgi:hypothetical protein